MSTHLAIFAGADLLLFSLTAFMFYRMRERKKSLQQQERFANTLVWQWSAIETLTCRHIQTAEERPAVTAVLHYLHTEFRHTPRIRSLKAILKARNSIVHHQELDVTKVQKLIEDADDIIRYLRNKAHQA